MGLEEKLPTGVLLTTLEDLFMRIVRENTPAGQSSVGSSPS